MVNLEILRTEPLPPISSRPNIRTNFLRTGHKLPLILLLFLSFSAASEPNITSLQLSKSSAEFSSIKGNGFGLFEGKVLSWDDFDSHTTISSISGLKALNGYSWSTSGDSIANIDRRYAQSGNQSIKLEWPPGTSHLGYFGWSGQEAYKQLYISYWHRLEGNFDSQVSRYEQLYLAGKAPGNAPQFKLEINEIDHCWTMHANFRHSQQSTTDLSNQTSCGTLITGKFQRWELTINLSQSTASVWLDGLHVFNGSAISDKSLGFTEVDFGYQTSGLSQQAITWFDDVYIASSQARVEACNTPEYARCSRRHLQYVEPENWRHNEIKLRLHNLRMFRGESIYLYVIDANGQVSNSIAIARPVMKTD